jgi:hypothetical protein
MSLGKFIELQVYSTRFQAAPSNPCEHVEENVFKFTLNFSYHNYVLTLSRLKTSAVLDLQVPWLQFQKADKNPKVPHTLHPDQDVFQGNTVQNEHSSDDVVLLTRQITDWFGGLTNHLTKVVSIASLTVILVFPLNVILVRHT